MFILIACTPNKQEQMEIAKKQVLATEREFAEFCKKVGRAEAFYKYADTNVVIIRDSLIKGKKALFEYYKARELKNTTLDWWPDFVEVSSSCDLGYTYGHYMYSKKDSTGRIINNKGIFHTVWKKQADGTWRYVWD